MHQVVLILHNIRSTYNVGAILRTAEGLGVEKVYLTGYTPYPCIENDDRLPHLASRIDVQIHKTALGAEALVAWSHSPEIDPVLKMLRASAYTIAGLEQHATAISLPLWCPTNKIALIVGNEVSGIEEDVLSRVDQIVEIPMHGHKESFNVAAATAMAVYHLTFQ